MNWLWPLLFHSPTRWIDVALMLALITAGMTIVLPGIRLTNSTLQKHVAVKIAVAVIIIVAGSLTYTLGVTMCLWIYQNEGTVNSTCLYLMTTIILFVALKCIRSLFTQKPLDEYLSGL